jgi:general secretion pathway protein C
MRGLTNIIVSAVSITLLSACALSQRDPAVEASPAARPHRFRVSVASGGKVVENPSDELVHRVAITPANMRAIINSSKDQGKVPLNGRAEYDNRGKPMGLRILQLNRESSLSSLGLKEKDLVTAIGPRLVSEPQHILYLFDDLRKSKRSSMTIERSGKPHKILYELQEPSP